MLLHLLRRRRTACALAAALLAAGWYALDAAPVAAETGYGTAVGYTTGADGGNSVVGSGTFFLAGSAGGNVNVGYECTSAATSPGSTGAGIQPPAHRGCYLERNGSIVSTAGGLHAPGSPVAVTANIASIPFLGTTTLRVCWNTYATFVSGYIVYTRGCTTISVVDSLPDLSTSTSENKDPYGFIWAIGTEGQNEGYRIVCVSVGGNTHNCGIGVTTSGASTTNGVSISGTGPSNSTCTLGSAAGCSIGAVAISGTGPAGTANCDYALVAVSATGDVCGTVAITGTGSAAGDYAVSGKETLCDTPAC